MMTVHLTPLFSSLGAGNRQNRLEALYIMVLRTRYINTFKCRYVAMPTSGRGANHVCGGPETDLQYQSIIHNCVALQPQSVLALNKIRLYLGESHRCHDIAASNSYRNLALNWTGYFAYMYSVRSTEYTV